MSLKFRAECVLETADKTFLDTKSIRGYIAELEAQLSVAEKLAYAALKFTGKFGSLEHPVESGFEDEFADLEINALDWLENREQGEAKP